MAVTLEEIAEQSGVSITTVRRALNGEEDIGDRTRQKIFGILNGTRYRPNRVARNLVLQKTHTIGVVIPFAVDSFFPIVIRSIENEVRKYHNNVILCHSDDRHEKEITEINLLLERRVDGLLIMPSADNDGPDFYLTLQEDGVPFVLIDRYIEGVNTCFVLNNDKKGAYQAVEHLIRLGHKKIAHISGPPLAGTAKGRMEGYKEALARYGIPFDTELVKGNGFNEENGYLTMKEILKSRNIPTAVFVVSDPAAIGALRAIEEEGLKVPNDIALVGFGDIKGVDILKVPLTTVHQPVSEIGVRAVGVLFKSIEGERAEGKIVLETALIIRESCGGRIKKGGLGGKEEIHL